MYVCMYIALTASRLRVVVVVVVVVVVASSNPETLNPMSALLFFLCLVDGWMLTAALTARVSVCVDVR